MALDETAEIEIRRPADVPTSGVIEDGAARPCS